MNVVGQLLRMTEGSEPIIDSARRCTSIVEVERIGARGNWLQLRWRVPGRFMTDRDWPVELTPEGVASIFLRQSGQRFVLLAQHNSLWRAFSDEIKAEVPSEKPRIAVPQLVHDLSGLASQDGMSGRRYRIGSLTASIDEYGRALRGMSLWGDDLAAAELFLELLRRIGPYRVGVRDIERFHEVASISNTGDIAMIHRGAVSLRELDGLLRFAKPYTHWDE